MVTAAVSANEQQAGSVRSSSCGSIYPHMPTGQLPDDELFERSSHLAGARDPDLPR